MSQSGTNWAEKRAAADNIGISNKPEHVVLRHTLKTLLGIREMADKLTSFLDLSLDNAELSEDTKKQLKVVCDRVKSDLTDNANQAQYTSGVLKVVINHGFQPAASFIQQPVNDDFTPEQTRHLEQILKAEVKTNSMTGSGPPAKKFFRDKSRDTCKACNARGHWASDAVCPLNQRGNQPYPPDGLPSQLQSQGQGSQYPYYTGQTYQPPPQYSLDYTPQSSQGQ